MSAYPDNRMALAAARRLTLEGTAARIVGALGVAGVRCVLLKGPTLSELYDGVRPYNDVDVLVAGESVGAAEAVLGELGFELRHDDPHSRIWSRAGVDVDLHTTLIGAHADPDVIWAALTSGTETFSLGGADVEGLNRAGRALHVTLHAAQHGAPRAEATRGPTQGARALSRGHLGGSRAPRRRGRGSAGVLERPGHGAGGTGDANAPRADEGAHADRDGTSGGDPATHRGRPAPALGNPRVGRRRPRSSGAKRSLRRPSSARGRRSPGVGRSASRSPMYGGRSGYSSVCFRRWPRSCGRAGRRGADGLGNGAPPAFEIEGDDRDEPLERRRRVVYGFPAKRQPRMARRPDFSLADAQDEPGLLISGREIAVRDQTAFEAVVP